MMNENGFTVVELISVILAFGAMGIGLWLVIGLGNFLWSFVG